MSKTSGYVSSYEYALLIGSRAVVLSVGADDPKVPCNPEDDPIDIATEEFRKGLCPIYIIRDLPNGEREYLNPNEMEYVP